MTRRAPAWLSLDIANCNAGRRCCGKTKEILLEDRKFLTAEEVSERYRGGVSVGTLRNWRAMRIGPAYVKVGKSVLYPITELEAWDQKNIVTCHAAKRLGMRGRDQR